MHEKKAGQNLPMRNLISRNILPSMTARMALGMFSLAVGLRRRMSCHNVDRVLIPSPITPSFRSLMQALNLDQTSQMSSVLYSDMLRES